MSWRLGLLLLLAWLVGGASGVSAAQELIPAVSIQIGSSRQVQLAPVDADALQRRLNQPPIVPGPPVTPAGDSYRVTSAYWDAALRRDPAAEPIEPAATYFPEGGYVRARQGTEYVWTVIDLRQRAILDRYIRLATTGQVGDQPSALSVLAAAAETETFDVEVAGKSIDPTGPRGLWRAVHLGETAPVFQDPPHRPAGVNGYWLVITLPEGRSLSYFYDTENQTLTDSLGTENHDARSLTSMGVLPAAAEAPQIEQQEPRGSLLWWPVMLGGSAACLAAAVWLRRRA